MSSTDFTVTYPRTYENPPAFGFETNSVNANVFYRDNFECKLRQQLGLPLERENNTSEQVKTWNSYFLKIRDGKLVTTTEKTDQAALTARKTDRLVKILSYFPIIGAGAGLYRIYIAKRMNWKENENWNEKKQAHIIRGRVELLSLGFAGPLLLILDIFMTIYDHCMPLRSMPARPPNKEKFLKIVAALTGAAGALTAAGAIGGGIWASITFSAELKFAAIAFASLTTPVGWAIIGSAVALVALIALGICHCKKRKKKQEAENEAAAIADALAKAEAEDKANEPTRLKAQVEAEVRYQANVAVRVAPNAQPPAVVEQPPQVVPQPAVVPEASAKPKGMFHKRFSVSPVNIAKSIVSFRFGRKKESG